MSLVQFMLNLDISIVYILRWSLTEINLQFEGFFLLLRLSTLYFSEHLRVSYKVHIHFII